MIAVTDSWTGRSPASSHGVVPADTPAIVLGRISIAPLARRAGVVPIIGGIWMSVLFQAFRPKLPFIIAGFASFLFSVWLYFVQDETTAGIFVGLWVPSIHSLGTLVLTQIDAPVRRESQEVQS